MIPTHHLIKLAYVCTTLIWIIGYQHAEDVYRASPNFTYRACGSIIDIGSRALLDRHSLITTALWFRTSIRDTAVNRRRENVDNLLGQTGRSFATAVGERSLIRTVSSPAIAGVFKNGSSKPVTVTLLTESGERYAMFLLRPQNIAETAVREGIVEIVDGSGKLTRYVFLPSHLEKRYFDSVNSRYYFRLTPYKIEPIRPRDAKTWMKSDSRGITL